MVDPDWMTDAHCATVPEWAHLADADQIDVCRTCPVRDACYAYGIATRSTDLVFGGIKFPKLPYRWKDTNGAT